MKKIIAIIMCAVAVLSLSACGEKKPTNNEVSITLMSTTSLTNINEEVALYVRTKNCDENTLFDFYEKKDGQESKIASAVKMTYIKKMEAGVYSYIAKANIGGKEYVSGSVEVTFENAFGVLLGMSPIGTLPSANVDFTEEKGNIDSYIVHKSVNKTSTEYAYFCGAYADRYCVSASLSIEGINGSDPYPKAGLLAAKVGARMICVLFDSRPSYTFGDLVIVEYVPTDGGRWMWPGTVVNSPAFSFRNSNGSKINHNLTVVRDKENFYVWVDDNYIMSKTFSGLTQFSEVGTFTMSQEAIFFGYSYTTDGAVIDEKLSGVR